MIDLSIFGLVRSQVSEKDGKTYYIIEYMSVETGKVHNDIISKNTYDEIVSQNIPPTAAAIAHFELQENNFAKVVSISVN